MLRGFRFVAAALVLLVASTATARRTKTDDLLRVISPTPKAPASAHPDVNVLVHFGTATTGALADPRTFRARLGREDVTALFQPLVENGVTVGVRAALPHDKLRIGTRRANRLRFLVETASSGRGKKLRAVERVRFRAVETPNQPPVAQIIPESTVIVPGLSFQLDGSSSYDPDGDALTYQWDFGDGTGATDATPDHLFPSGIVDPTVHLVVSDGQAASTASVALLSVPPVPPGKTAGSLAVQSTDGLEFGAVALGTQATRVVHVANVDTTDTSWLSVRVAVDGPGFGIAPPTLDLGPGASGDVTVTFAPTTSGHASARLGLVASASNRQALSFIAHGFGGSAPGSGPTLAGIPLFYTELAPVQFGFAVRELLPDGTLASPDNGVHTCHSPNNGPGTYDLCVTDADCAANNGGTCQTTDVCLGGSRAGQPCTVATDCPNGFCPAYSSFDPVEMCSDGAGGLYLLSDDGTYTDPNPNNTDPLGVSVLALRLDAQGNVTGKKMLDRTTSDTSHLACDGFSAAAKGRVLLAEYHALDGTLDCFRSDKESLVSLRKDTGTAQTLMSRIDAAEGIPACDDYDTVSHLEVSRDGGAVFATFDSTGATWRIWPTPLEFVAPPPIGTTWKEIPADAFRVLPDGGLVFATSLNGSSAGVIKLYRVAAAQVAQDPTSLSGIAPCATYEVPNNGDATHRGFTSVLGIAAAPTVAGSRDGTVLVTFTSSANGLTDVVSSSLSIKGTVAFSAPADGTGCSLAGLVNLAALDQMTF